MVTLTDASFATDIAHNFRACVFVQLCNWSSRAFPGDLLPAFEDPQFGFRGKAMTEQDGAVGGVDADNPRALTALERHIVDLLIGGLTGEEVGDLLGIDRRSVAQHRASAMRKYGARNGMHLAHLVEIARHSAAARTGLVVLEDVPSSLGF